MRILDQSGKEMNDYDPSLGHVENEKIIIRHHEASDIVEEQSHYETIKEYPNGGKEVRKVIDVPAQEAHDAYDEYEDILRFVPYTLQELNEIEIGALKMKLADTDYIIMKIVEGATTLEKEKSIIAQRAIWRKRINDLEDAGKDDEV